MKALFNKLAVRATKNDVLPPFTRGYNFTYVK